MRSITVLCLLLLLLISSVKVGSFTVGEEYEFKIEKVMNLLRESDDDNLNYEKNTHIEFSLRVTMDEYDTQNKVVTYTISNSIQYQYQDYKNKMDLSNISHNQFLIPTLLVSNKNSINYIVDIIFYESLDLPTNLYPFLIFGTEGINQALLNFQTLDAEIPGIDLRGRSIEFSQYTLHSLLDNASSYIFMGESSIDQGLKNVNNDTKSWDFEIELKNFQIYNEILDEFLKYNQYSSGIKLSYTDDFMLSALESNVDYIANGSNYIETKSTVYKVTLVGDGSNRFDAPDLLQMPVLSGLLIIILLILIMRYHKGN